MPFPNGITLYRQGVEVAEHHIGVYARKEDGRIIRAPHPRGLLHGSLVSSTLAAAIINGKYVTAVPLYRLEQEFGRYGLTIPRQSMANWCIRLAEEYLAVLYTRWKRAPLGALIKTGAAKNDKSFFTAPYCKNHIKEIFHVGNIF